MSGVTLRHDLTLADLTTLQLGGRPAAVIECATREAIAEVTRKLDESGTPVLIVGGGSNLVIADEVADLVVLHITAAEVAVDAETGLVEADAGAEWDTVVAATVAAGLGGLECLSGIPGSAGATPVQNVGAYGAEVSSSLAEVLLYNRETGSTEWVSPESLGLSYRYSNLKFTGRAVVLAVRFQLTTDGLSVPLRYGELARRLEAEGGDRRPVAKVRETVLDLRRGKGMVLIDGDRDTASAGSFFTNPVLENQAEADAVRTRVAHVVNKQEADAMPTYPGGGERVKLSAAWLIERAGFAKGYPGADSPVRLSTKHTLALTNRGGATTADLVGLARTIRDGVRREFGVELHPEPVWVGVSLDG